MSISTSIAKGIAGFFLGYETDAFLRAIFPAFAELPNAGFALVLLLILLIIYVVTSMEELVTVGVGYNIGMIIGAWMLGDWLGGILGVVFIVVRCIWNGRISSKIT